jgi:type IV secretion system protein TrbC
MSPINKGIAKACRSPIRRPMQNLWTAIWRSVLTAVGLFAISLSPADAAAAGAPWEAPLQTFLNSLTGPVAQIVGVAAVVMCGFAIAFSEGGGGIRKLVWVALGLSIAFAATTFFLPLFGFAGGLAV